jgi:hypothetical protein
VQIAEGFGPSFCTLHFAFRSEREVKYESEKETENFILMAPVAQRIKERLSSKE